ncbi:MAG: ATP-binding protein [Gammaproteobacteria bacterium]
MLHLARLLLISVSLFVGALATGAPVDTGPQRLLLSPHVQWLPEPGVATLEDALVRRDGFIDIVDDANLGRMPGRWWFRVALRNPSSTAQDWLLVIPFGHLETVDFHQLRAGGEVARIQTGTTRPFSSRPVPVEDFVFPLHLAAGETSAVYLQVEGRVALNVPLLLFSPTAFAEEAAQESWWHGLFYGLIAGLLAYNLSLWLTTRDPAFLYFIGTGVTALGFFAGYDGLFRPLLPDAVWFNQILMFVAGALSVGMTLQFTRHFLDTPRILPEHDGKLRAVAISAVPLALLVPFIPLDVTMALVLAASLLMALLMLLAGYTAWRAGEPLSRLFMTVISIHFSVLLLLGLGASGLVEGLFALSTLIHHVSLAVILSLFSMALGERVKATARARRVAEAEVLQSRADARARNEFLAKMSHELRTPMTGVLGMAELLEHTELQPQQRRYLSTLRYSGEMLLNLINDVLDHARIEAGRLQIRREAFDLLRLVDDCRLLFEQQPRENKVVLHIDIASGVPRIVVGDAQRIRQILVNLLSNAFKFTSAGSVTLHIAPLPSGWLRFEVRDTGAGIEPADRERLFRLFSQATEGRSVKGGSGLGLAICRQLSELMGGRIGVESVPGEGSVFRVELPLHAAG